MPGKEPLVPTAATASRSMADHSSKGGLSLPAVPVLQRSSGGTPASPNNTGLPDNLKTGVEQLSGLDMSDVQVHYNSDKPAQLNALAYAQGTDIHIGRGQEKHLPHEAWHVVQQKQGRVQPTVQRKTGIAINDDPALEKEADRMGAAALQLKQTETSTEETSPLIAAHGHHNYPLVSQLVLNSRDAAILHNDLTTNRLEYKLSDDGLLQKVEALITNAFNSWAEIQPYRREIVAEAIKVAWDNGDQLVWSPPEQNEEMEPVDSTGGGGAKDPKAKDEGKVKDEGKRREEDFGMIDIEDFELEIPTMKDLITGVEKWGGHPQMNKEAKNRASEALSGIVKNIKEPDTLVLQAIIQPMLAAHNECIRLKSPVAAGTANKRQLIANQEAIIDECVQKLQLQTKPKEDVTLPAGIIYPADAATVRKTGADGNPYDLGVKYQTITSKIGAAKGEEAAGSPASNYLTSAYGRNVNFVAGHLVTRKAGGPNVPANLAPFTQTFNQGVMRTPESTAERLLREDKVIRYRSEVRAWAPVDLILVVPKKADLELIVAQVKVDITEMKLQPLGNPNNIAHWNIEGKSYSY